MRKETNLGMKGEKGDKQIHRGEKGDWYILHVRGPVFFSGSGLSKDPDQAFGRFRSSSLTEDTDPVCKIPVPVINYLTINL